VLGDVAWNQDHIRQAMKSTGRWAIKVEHDGHYTFRLRRWPTELGLPIDAILQDEASVGIAPSTARLSIGDFETTVDVQPGAESVLIEADLTAGRTELEAWFIDEDDDERGAYYVYVERV